MNFYRSRLLVFIKVKFGQIYILRFKFIQIGIVEIQILTFFDSNFYFFLIIIRHLLMILKELCSFKGFSNSFLADILPGF